MDFAKLNAEQAKRAKTIRRQEKKASLLSTSLSSWQKSVVKLTLYDRGSRSGRILWVGCGVVCELSGKDAVLGGDVWESSSEEEEEETQSNGNSMSNSNSAANTPMSPSRGIKGIERGMMLGDMLRSPKGASKGAMNKKDSARYKRRKERANRTKCRAKEASYVVMSSRKIHPNSFSAGHCHIQFYDESSHPIELTSSTAASLQPGLFHYTPPLYEKELGKLGKKDRKKMTMSDKTELARLEELKHENELMDWSFHCVAKESRPKRMQFRPSR